MTDAMSEAPVKEKRPLPGGQPQKKRWFAFMNVRNPPLDPSIQRKKFRRKNYSMLSENILDDSAERSLRNRSRIIKPKKFKGYVNTLEALADIDKRFKSSRKAGILNEVPDFGNANSDKHLQKLLNSGSIKISQIGFLNKSCFDPSVNLIPLVESGESFLNPSVKSECGTEHDNSIPLVESSESFLNSSPVGSKRGTERDNSIPLVESGESFLNSSPVRSKRGTEHETADSSKNKKLKSSNFSRQNASESKISDVISHNMEINNKCRKTIDNGLPQLRANMKSAKRAFNLNGHRISLNGIYRQRFVEAITCFIDDRKLNYQNNVAYDKSKSLVKCPHRLLTLTPIFRPTSFILERDHPRERLKSEHKLLVDFRNEKSKFPDIVPASPKKDVACGGEISKDSVVNSIERHIDCKQCEEAFNTEECLLHTMYYRFCNEIPSEMFKEIKRRKKSILKRILLQKWDMKLDALFVCLANWTIAAFYGETKEAFLKIVRKKRSQMYGDFESPQNEEYANQKSYEEYNKRILEMRALRESVAVAPQPSIVKKPYEKCTELVVYQPGRSLTDSVTVECQTKEKKMKTGNGMIKRQTKIKKKKTKTGNVRIEGQTKVKKTKTDDVTIDCQRKKTNTDNMAVVCQTKQKETKTDDVRLNVEDCATVLLDFNKSDPTIPPDSIQMVECSLPVTEAINLTTLQEICLFRQTFKSFDSLIQCFFCKNKLELLYLYLPLHLKKHYETKHQLSVHMCAAKYDTDSEFITVPSKLTDDTVLDHACVYCDSRLRNRADVNQHYSVVHKKTAVLVAEEELASLEELIYCSLCNHPSKNLILHRLHMVQEHTIRTYSCPLCSFSTYHPMKLGTHVRKIHDHKFKCAVCSVLLNGQKNVRRHIITHHVVKTGTDEWFCTTCLDPFKNLDELVIHVRVCIENAPALSSKSSNEGTRNSTSAVSCENDSLTINLEKTVPEEITNMEEKHACFLCDKSFSTLVTYEEHTHHVHKQWVRRKKASKSVTTDSPKEGEAENKETTLNNQKSCIDAEITVSSTEKNLDCLLPNDESSENEAESPTSRLSSAEASKLNICPQLSTEAEEISNSTPGSSALNVELTILSEEYEDSQEHVSFSSLPDDHQLSKIGFPEKVGHFCHICNTVIQNYRLYYMHMHNLHKLTKMFQCNVSSCWKIFGTSSDFEDHALKHSQKHDIFCRLCDVVFADEEEKRQHLSSSVHRFLENENKKNKTMGNYRCKICDTVFYLHQSFVKHMETNSHRYDCPHCNHKSILPQLRRHHIESCHSELAKTCEECSMQFPDAKSVLKHFVVHKFIFECSVCGSKFFQKEQLDMHSEFHEKQLFCPVSGCKQWFSFGVLKYYLFHHLRNYHKLFEDLTCPRCSLVFKYDFQLFKHWTFENNIIKCKDGSVISLTPPERKPVEKPSLVKKYRTIKPKKSKNVAEITSVTHTTVTNTLSVKPTYTYAKSNMNIDNNVKKTTSLNINMAYSAKLPQIVKLQPNKVLTFNVSKGLTDKNESSNSLETVDANKKPLIVRSTKNPTTKVFLVNEDMYLKCISFPMSTKTYQDVQFIESNADKNLPVLTVKQEPVEEQIQLGENMAVQFTESNVDENLPVLTVKEEPVEEPIQLDENMASRFISPEKPTETCQQFIESNVDKNLPVVTIKQEPVEEQIHVDENRILDSIPSEKPTETTENMQAIESDVDKNLPVLTVKQEPIEEPIQLDKSRTSSLESSAKSSEVVRTAEETLQVVTVKQEPPEESAGPYGGSVIEKSRHLTVVHERIKKSVVLEGSIQASTNVSDVQLDFNKKIPDQIAGQSVQSDNPKVSVLKSTQRNVTINQLDEAVIQQGKTFMHIPVEMIQLACAGCLCMFESKDHFLDHVCTGQVADNAAGRIVVVPEDGSNTGIAEWVCQSAVPDQLVSTNHATSSDSSSFKSQILDKSTMLPYVKNYLGGQLRIVPTDKKPS